MGAAAYLVGSVAALLAVAALGLGAWRLRRALLPEWTGAPARLAEIVVGVGTAVLLAQLLGTFGQLRRVPLLLAYVGAGAVLVVVATRVERPASETGAAAAGFERSVRAPRIEIVGVVLAGALVAAQWATHIGVTYSRGMTHGDTLWYQATFAARWLQTGRLTELDATGVEDLATPLHGMLPLTGTLVHTIVMLPFDNDLLSPLVNLGWAVITLLAAWCIGRRFGAGPLVVLAAVMLLGVPTIAGTQPGQAANDIATAGLFLAAVALLLEGKLAPFPTALAGVAAGLALGVKLTVLVPTVVVTIGIAFIAIRTRRAGPVLAWLVGLLPFAAYWPIRNWVVVGNPLPWSELDLGPITLSKAIPTRPALISVLDDWFTWREFVLPGFSKSLGRGWFVILVLVLAGAVLGFLRRRSSLDPWLGLSVVAGLVGVAFIPFGSDLGGGAFVFMVRYLAAELLVGLGLLAVAVTAAPVLWRRALLVILLALVVLDATARHLESIPAWPSDQIALGVVTGLLVVGVGAVLLFAPEVASRSVTKVTAGVALVALIGGGWLLQRSYFDHRYVDAGLPHDAANELFNGRHDERIAVLGTEHFYPFFGNDLSNRVSRELGPERGSEGARCRSWRRILAGYDFIVLGHQAFSPNVPADEWIAPDPAATVVLRDADTTVYRLDGDLDPRVRVTGARDGDPAAAPYTPAIVDSASGAAGGAVATDTAESRRRDALRTVLVIGGLLALLAVPLVIALGVLLRPTWYPLLDMSQTELRVRDVWSSHPPLIGLAGRIGPFGAQGSHLGPMSFWSLWPFYQLFGAGSWALEAAASASICSRRALRCGSRSGGVASCSARIGLVLAVAHARVRRVCCSRSRGTRTSRCCGGWCSCSRCGRSVLPTYPMLPVVVVAGSFCVQTHISYLGLVGGVGVLAIGVVAYAAYASRKDPDGAARAIVRWTLVAVAIGVVLWIPPLLDQFVHDPGNLTVVREHFSDPPEAAVGLGDGLRVFFGELNPWRVLTHTLAAEGLSTAATGSVIPGLGLLAAWAASAVAAWRLRHAALVRLDAMLAVATVLGVISAARIFGFLWFYLVLWVAAISALMLLAIGWTVVEIARQRGWFAAPAPRGTCRRSRAGGLDRARGRRVLGRRDLGGDPGALGVRDDRGARDPRPQPHSRTGMPIRRTCSPGCPTRSRSAGPGTGCSTSSSAGASTSGPSRSTPRVRPPTAR